MDAVTIGEFIISGVVLIIGYFVKVVHTDVRQNTKDVGENKGSINTLRREIEHESQMRNQSYVNIMQILSEIKEELKTMKNP